MTETRNERDSMGEVLVPADALYGAQTQRAIDNFRISGIRMPAELIHALALIKLAAARTNRAAGLLAAQRAEAVERAARRIAAGEFDHQFPVDVFQTGSGTSTNMNMNEVVASLGRAEGIDLHPNDDVNCSQSSNDTIPTAIHVAAALLLEKMLLPGLTHLEEIVRNRAASLSGTVKPGRTHLMDAMPITFGQELACWAAQIAGDRSRLQLARDELLDIPQGGTAVGTGFNAPVGFGAGVAEVLRELTGLAFQAAANPLAGMSGLEGPVSVSAQLKVLATTLIKIANDLRLMNSGPGAGIGEIRLSALQPGSSMMPGKINPVIPEAVAMVGAQIIGNDTAITVAGQAGNFQLNTMLPLIAHNLLGSIRIAGNACRVLADSAIRGFEVREQRISASLAANPVLITALTPRIGYERAAAIAGRAFDEGRPIREVTREMSDLSDEEIDRLLDPARLTQAGLAGKD
jgi:fumarate hydratase class II